MGLFNDKKGVDLIWELIMFVILNALFFGGMFIVVFRVCEGAAYYEQSYAKQIALLVDGSKPGTQILINADVMQKFIKDNKIPLENVVSINNNKIIVKLSPGDGYSFVYFSDYDVEKIFSIGPDGNLVLNLNIKEKTAK